MANSWREISDKNSLSFRSAANAAAAPASRPLTSTVLREVRSNADAEVLFAALKGQADGDLDEDVFFNQLAADPRWATIVAECSDAVRKRDAFYKRIWTWLQTRQADGVSPGSHLARAAVTATSIGLSIPVGFYLADKGGLKVPVAFEPAAESKPLTVAWTTEASGGKIPVEVGLVVDGKAMTEVPVRLSATAADLRLRVDAVSGTDLSRLSANADRAASSMATTAENLAALQAPMARISEAITQKHTVSVASIQDLDKLASHVADVGTALREDRVGRQEFTGLTEAFARGGNAMAVMATVAREGKTVTTAAVAPNVNTTVVAHWSDASGTIRRCDVEVETGDIGRIVEVEKIVGRCPIPDSSASPIGPIGARRLRPGDVVHLGAQPLAIVVDAVRRPLWGKPYALLRVISTSSPLDVAQLVAADSGTR